MRTWKAQPISDDVAQLGEGTRWDATRGELNWVDVLRGVAYRSIVDPHWATIVRHEIGQPVSLVVPTESGGWLAALETTVGRIGEDGSMTTVAQIPVGSGCRLNDGGTDPAGRFYIGSMANDASPGRGALWRLVDGGRTECVRSNATIANGLSWSPDGSTLYWIDSIPGILHVITYDPRDGLVGDTCEQHLLRSGDAAPDGMAVDAEGNLWVAMWDGWSVDQIAPDGRRIGRVELPVARPTSCCFGGADGSTLLITTATHGLSPSALAEQAEAGRVFAVDVGTSGLPCTPYRDTI
jgi:sugar lactone lactonase YvrE